MLQPTSSDSGSEYTESESEYEIDDVDVQEVNTLISPPCNLCNPPKGERFLNGLRINAQQQQTAAMSTIAHSRQNIRDFTMDDATATTDEI